MKATAVILAAGKGVRFGGDKVLARLGGKPVWRWSFDAFLAHPGVSSVGIVASPTNIEGIRAEAPEAAFVVVGGETRQDSSRIACENASDEVVLIHDAARPFISSEVIDRVLEAALRGEAVAPAVGVHDTVRQVSSSGVLLLDRTELVGMQTPQGASRARLLEAHGCSDAFTDEMGLFEALGVTPTLVEGDSRNFKITSSEDLAKARGLLGYVETRTGLGYDIHAFSTDPARPMWLGGVEFEGPGLEGHSDADAVIHACVDALLGAASLGDIGQHFPPSDPRWKNEPSSTFLSFAASLLKEAGWAVVNLDISIVAERPKVMGRSSEMKAAMASSLGIEPSRIGIKATTNEGLGAIGRGEGIAAFAVATIREA